jgi:prepilin-type N-terminal cleavage/methylation domain-containing protein
MKNGFTLIEFLITITIVGLIAAVVIPAFKKANEAKDGAITSNKTVEINGYNWDIKVVEGCEYISYDRSLAHKGNCTNSIHIYNTNK